MQTASEILKYGCISNKVSEGGINIIAGDQPSAGGRRETELRLLSALSIERWT